MASDLCRTIQGNGLTTPSLVGYIWEIYYGLYFYYLFFDASCLWRCSCGIICLLYFIKSWLRPISIWMIYTTLIGTYIANR